MKKTIIEMVEQCQGGKSAAAGFLGLTEQAYGVSHWSDEINRRVC